MALKCKKIKIIYDRQSEVLRYMVANGDKFVLPVQTRILMEMRYTHKAFKKKMGYSYTSYTSCAETKKKVYIRERKCVDYIALKSVIIENYFNMIIGFKVNLFYFEEIYVNINSHVSILVVYFHPMQLHLVEVNHDNQNSYVILLHHVLGEQMILQVQIDF